MEGGRRRGILYLRDGNFISREKVSSPPPIYFFFFGIVSPRGEIIIRDLVRI